MPSTITTLPDNTPDTLGEPLWTVEELARYLSISPKTVLNRRASQPGALPPAISIGRSPRWVPADVRAWIESRREVA